MPRRSSPWAPAWPSAAALRHDEPREPRGHDRVLRGQPPLRTGSRAVLHPGADAGCRQACRQGLAGRQGPCRPEPRRPRRHARRAAAPGPDGSPSCLDEMRERGIQTLFYFQVDNPLVQIADPAFLGLTSGRGRDVLQDHRATLARRETGRGRRRRRPSPGDRVPRPPARARRPARAGGWLALSAGSIAIHVLDARSSSGSSATTTCRSIAQ